MYYYYYYYKKNYSAWLYSHGLLDNSPTNQLAVSQVADWSTRGLVNSPTAIF